jgi:pimeloyl-ACP methyl ester carboxylesterase
MAPRTARRPLLVLACSALGCGAPDTGTAPGVPGALEGYFPSVGARLHYVLDLPPGGGPFPAVVMGHGAGRSTKDETRFLVPFWTGHGFAVLRYDRRGVGLSSGVYSPLGPLNSEVGVPQLAGDMVAGVEFLRTRSEIGASSIGLMGISQAGWLMVAAAATSPDVSFFVAPVGSTLPVSVNTFYEGLRARPIDEAYALLEAYDGPQGWDPLPALRSLTIPALWLLGEDDRLVPTRICAPRVRALAAEGRRYTVRTYPGGHEIGGALGTWAGDLDAWLRAEGLSR